jgi:hypothetical protein
VHIAWKYAAVAASVLVLLLAGYTFGSRQSQQHAERWGEYEEAEKYYTTRVQEKMALISTLGVGDEVLSDIKVLDDVYHQLRAEMMDDPNADPQILLSAMIRHQQQKLSIMEKIVNRVDKYKSNEEGNREI